MIFACFLGASKAFDGINHWKLLYTLIDRHTHPFLFSFCFRLSVCCSTGADCINFLCSGVVCFLDFITIANGVWRGSLSPLLFKLYADNLSCKVSEEESVVSRRRSPLTTCFLQATYVSSEEELQQLVLFRKICVN